MHLRTKRTRAGTFATGFALAAALLVPSAPGPAAVAAVGAPHGFPWQEARFGEYRTYGPGAGITGDRPQMSERDAAHHDVADYLAGEDGWAPHRTQH
ncbi:hypothetical protein [Streptomyces sp. NPDC055749]